ncbi:hypothetical protein [Desulfosporosinus lacus]|uniref:hypothetical protein n=1 Tax=Desulfosporosinus lacus TaxID=329936 RepID=UPI001A9A6CD2|nr:hypothetical protein [Desulfosporosinus lacus]
MGVPYSTSVTIVSGGEYRRSRGPNRNAYWRRKEDRRAPFPIGTLGAKEVEHHPTPRKLFVCGSASSA